MNVTKYTYSLMLCTPLKCSPGLCDGYHFVLCGNLFVTVLIVKQFIVLSETVVFLNIEDNFVRTLRKNLGNWISSSPNR